VGLSENERAVLWDLDGTLVDTEEFHWQAWVETMAAEGRPLTREQFLGTFGQRNASFLGGWLGPQAGPADITRVGEAKEALCRELIRERGCPLLPGAREWLERLRSAGWLQAVASSAPRVNVEVMLDGAGIRSFFAATVAAEDVSAGKPDPQVFLTAASRLGVDPRRCVVVEDAAAGIEGARRARIPSIGIGRNGTRLGATVEALSLADLPPDVFETLLG
jgi:beta-phosphoglucomutase